MFKGKSQVLLALKRKRIYKGLDTLGRNNGAISEFVQNSTHLNMYIYEKLSEALLETFVMSLSV